MQDTEPDPGVDRAGDVSSSTPHLTGASLSRLTHFCATVAKQCQNLQRFKEHFAVDFDSTVTRRNCPANEPETEAAELLAEELEKAPGLLRCSISTWDTWRAHALPNGRSRRVHYRSPLATSWSAFHEA